MRYKIDIFYMYVDILLDTLYILDIILNNSHWDDLVPSYLFSFKKQNYKSMTKLKKLDVRKCQACKSLDTGNKFLNSIWMWGQNKIRYKL